MDGSRFDAVARALAGETTRRGFAAGLAALAAGLVGFGAARSACPPGQVSVRGACRCKKTGRAPAGGVCPCVAGLSDTGDGLGCLACRTDDECPVSTVCGGGGTPHVCGCPGIPDGQGCTSNEACCSGICQAGACVATVAGTCPANENYCLSLDFGTCGNGRCACVIALDGSSVCGETYRCLNCTSDADCGEPYVCLQLAADCCGTERTCVFPCRPSSCFTGETRVAMADGTSRRIDEVEVGEDVLGRDGNINRVVEIERPPLGHRRLYALNEGAYFVTAEHPILTDTGWKSIDPAATAAENATLRVGRLAVGDRLMALAGVLAPVGAGRWAGGGVVEVAVEPVLLRSIESRTADPTTPLYNLRLDGDHAYFANDLLVHNK